MPSSARPDAPTRQLPEPDGQSSGGAGVQIPRSLMAATVAGSREAVTILDSSFTYLYVNRPAGVMLNREPSSLVGRSHLVEFPDAAGSDFHEACVRARDTSEVQVLRTSHGPWHRHVEHRIHPTVDGLSVLSSEISTVQPGTLTGIDGAEYLRAVLDAAPVCIKVVARDGRLLDMNAAGLRILDVPDLESVRGASVLGLVAAEDRVTFQCATDSALRGESQDVTFCITTQSGAKRLMEAKTAPLRARDGTVFATLSVTQDITEREVVASRLRESEARYRTLVETAHEGICSTDVDGMITYANPYLASLLHCDISRLIGRSYFDLLAPAERPSARARLAAQKPAASDTRDLTLCRTDGSQAWVAASASALLSDDGSLRGWLLIFRDLTEERQAQQALRQSEERYAVAARATRSAIWEWDIASDTVTWSEGLAAVFGHAREHGGGQLTWWNDAIHDDDRERVLAGLKRATGDASAGEWRESYRFRRADGTWAEVVDRGYITRAESGIATRMIGAMEDVTIQRTLEAQLRQAQKMEAVGLLAAGVAHDFNNLLTVIVGNVELADVDLPNDCSGDHPVRGAHREIAFAADRASNLVRQLLLFSRQQPVRRQLVRMSDAVRGAEKLLRRVIGEEIVLTTTLDDGEARVFADVGGLEQLLMNLAVNARDAMLTAVHGHPGTGGSLELVVDELQVSRGSAPEWARVPDGHWVRLSVRDTGHGIDAETQVHVFEPFFTTKAVGAGTGLGLSTVFGIVQQSGGFIHLESAPGRGTTFTILLPVAHGVEDSGDDAMPTALTPRTRAGTVLLVEDEEMVRRTTQRMLERRGYVVLEARNGREAVQLWRTHGPQIDAVITDVRMPEMGGHELVAQLRDERSSLPVVFVSGYQDQSAAPPGREHEARVVKPFNADSLLGALSAARRDERS